MKEDWKQQIDRLHADLVRRDDPVAWVNEADAVQASCRYPHIAVRGALFGIATQDSASGTEWRLRGPMADGTPQQARDGLNSKLWFRALEDTDDPAVRRELLKAVAVLERERVDELEVLGVRYRVVRADEFARSGEDGLEPPRPTDTEPADRSWTGPHKPPSRDDGHVLDPGRKDGLMAGALKLGLRDFAYAGARYPADVREDSERAATTHPDIALLPVGFGIAERVGKGWRPRGSLMPTPHDARRLLHDALTDVWPRLYELGDDERARYARAAERFKATGRDNELRVGDRLFRVCRIERLVRWGPDGPEPPRPSDQANDYEPMKIHPTMDDDGTVHHDR
ncbi:DUF5954 family protein [Streptomyces sp. NPDC000151]|uniref:DUF5954 family protein n=1 Tax=Streptomyces sp. NPDC000151 TaxID=3154244 RepID=UPI003323EABA